MPKLTRNETYLLLVLGLILFAGANFFGYRALRQKEAAQTLEYAQLRADQAEAKVSLQSTAIWEQREKWISQHQPVGKDTGDAQAQTLQFVLKGARDKGLQVMEQSLSETSKTDNGFRVEVSLTVKGSMQALTQWLAELQDPASFYALPYMSLKADTDQKSIIGTFHIYRFFKKGTA